MGPLAGIKVVEIASIGPGPFAAMLLADLGAEVLRIDRAGGGVAPINLAPQHDLLNRGRRSVAVDLKHPDGAGVVLRLVERADALVEGFRPGVAERLGIGPAACRDRNPHLVYGRMTGWGQSGPLAHTAGHDIDYIAVAGALHPIGPAAAPVPPLNLIGDFGGGAMFLALGIVAALVERQRSGEGQVVDAAMVDGAAVLTTMFHGLRAAGGWTDDRAANLLDGGAPFYGVYETADGGHVAVGALEPQFFAELLEGLGIDPADVPAQYDRDGWPQLRAAFATAFRARTRAEWASLFADTDACVAPVLSLGEAPGHPHNAARETFLDLDGIVQPAPAPRFERTPAGQPGPPPRPGEHAAAALGDWGFSAAEVAALRSSGALG